MSRIVEVVLTGGPCAGKTTALSHIAAELAPLGWRVLTTPEPATTFVLGGVHDVAKVTADPSRSSLFQRALINHQRRIRTSYQEMAAALGDNTLIVYDRAELDGAAYVGREVFAAILQEDGLSLPTLRDSYAHVIHMESAAVGAPEAYTVLNNAARQENVEEARDADRRTLASWLGHPRLTIIPSSLGFAQKLADVVDVILRSVGEKPTLPDTRFLLDTTPDLSFDNTDVTRIHLEEIYYHGERYRKVITEGVTSYVQGRAPERPASISEWLAATSSPKLLTKNRYCFTYNSRRYALDEYLAPRRGFILKTETPRDGSPAVIPPFLGTGTDITPDRSWRGDVILSA